VEHQDLLLYNLVSREEPEITNNRRANKGQFSIIAALLVSVILVTAVISSYTTVRHPQIQDSPKILTAIGETNSDIQKVLDFTIGHYGSILQVTGNSTYARGLASRYLFSGLVNIAHSHPEWNPSFKLDFEHVSTSWFMPKSYSLGNISVVYSLASLGIEDVKYETSSALMVETLESVSGVARIAVTYDNGKPELGLSKEDFWFYKYNYDNSVWEFVNPTSLKITSNGVYNITLPAGVDIDVYSVKVEDNRGLVVSAFYSSDSVVSGIPSYTYHFDWESTGMLDIYESLNTDTFAIELLQNGTLKWLDQPLELIPKSRPIYPIPVKAFHINATINGVNQEVPFQVEDWASDYSIPLGLSGNTSLISRNNMFVFLLNNEISETKLWWNGEDTEVQTPYAWRNIYFNDNPSSGLLENSRIELDIHNFWIESTTVGGSTNYRADFLRINGDDPSYGAEPAYVIYNGIVRDIVQQEPEFSGGGVPNSPNLYSQVVITLPANTPYYTYAVRTNFVDSLQPRIINDFSVVQLSNLNGAPMTEDGTSEGYPVSSSYVGIFSDGSPNGWDHHWSQFISGNIGAGVMFTDTANEDLYLFDNETGTETGALVVDDHWSDNSIEVNPVELTSVAFDSYRDVIWHGAIVTFSDEPIYPSDGYNGLWVMVEHPPVVMMSEYEASGIDFVDTNLSNEDSSNDKGSHSKFVAEKFGPDSVYDILTEENTGGTISTTLIDAESFEGYSWPPSGWSETGSWARENDYAHDGTFSADFDGSYYSQSGYLTSPSMDCSDAEVIYVDFWWYDDSLDNDDFELEYYDGNAWDNYQDLNQIEYGNGWHHYTEAVTDSQYFVSNFRIRWYAETVSSGETGCVDLVTVEKGIPGPTNYELDLEVQWTSVDCDEANEELCIYVGATSVEDLGVDVWTGSSWENLFTNLNVGWNNVTISPYLTSSIFTIRFIGQTETGDNAQDYWTIDATLLHCWT
jgi:hypothetical protein